MLLTVSATGFSSHGARQRLENAAVGKDLRCVICRRIKHMCMNEARGCVCVCAEQDAQGHAERSRQQGVDKGGAGERSCCGTMGGFRKMDAGQNALENEEELSVCVLG